MTPLVLGLAAAVATLAGGLLALRGGNETWLLMSVAAGVVLGVAIFDLLPEAISAGAGSVGLRSVMAAVTIGFGLYLLMNRRSKDPAARRPRCRQHLIPATLAFHSLVDGLGIGLAFQVDTRAGWLVAAAVLTHDFADGVNTVGPALAAGSRNTARTWLVVNAASPVAGVVLGQRLQVTSATLALVLAALAGAFLHIGACELLPRSRAYDRGFRVTAANLGGMLLMGLVAELIR